MLCCHRTHGLSIPAALFAVFSTTVCAQPVCTPPPSGIVGWWPGDGNAKDIIGNNNGTLVGASFTPTGCQPGSPGCGEVGQAFSFNGASYVNIPTSVGLPTSDWTIEFWFLVNGNPFSQGFVTNFLGAGSRYFIETDAGPEGLIIGHFTFGPADLITTEVPSTRAWHHLAAIQSATTNSMALYLDGNPLSGNLSGQGSVMSDPIIHLLFGQRGDGAFFLNGLMDEISIYNRPLLPSEIQAIVNAGNAGKCKPCQVNVSRTLTGQQRSLTRQPTEMNATFTTSSGLSLVDAASACDADFVGFDWQQTITTMPCPSPFRANPANVKQQNLCSDLSLKAPPSITDPPPGGYISPPRYLGYDPSPFYYYSTTAQNQEQSPTNYCIDYKVPCTPLVSSDDMTLAFYDMPSNPCLPFARPDLNKFWCGGVTAPLGSSMQFTTALVGIKKDGTASPALFQWTWSDTFNGTSGGIPTTSNNLPADTGSGTGGVTITSINGNPQTPPAVTCAASPGTLWPPDSKPTLVTVSGTITPGTSALVANGTGYEVIDEYGQVQPSGNIALGASGDYSFDVSLIAARNGDDRNGRTYAIIVTGTDTIGNVGSCSTLVNVPHDQGH